MTDTNQTHKRSFIDRRSTKNRRDRWWRLFIKRSEIIEDRRGDVERRNSSEKRTEWERITKWSSAPKLRPYRFPYLHAISRFNDYPFW